MAAHLFADFHIHGASAPEWNQRYLQMSPGVMRSSLAECTGAGVHVFGKWMSERVVQQGGLPRGQVCFAFLANATRGPMRAQGREFGERDLLVLRGGQEFEFQRPPGTQLLSVTFDEQLFAAWLDAARGGRLGGDAIVRPLPDALDALRGAIRRSLAGGTVGDASPLMAGVHTVLAGAVRAPSPRASSIAAAHLVKSCQDIVRAEAGAQVPRIEDLCRRLGTSRRTLQGSFNTVAGTGPLAYLRNLRLNAVRRRLLSSAAGELSVSQAASEAGFDHFGHFAGGYRKLFGELPSRTRRRRP